MSEDTRRDHAARRLKHPATSARRRADGEVLEKEGAGGSAARRSRGNSAPSLRHALSTRCSRDASLGMGAALGGAAVAILPSASLLSAEGEGEMWEVDSSLFFRDLLHLQISGCISFALILQKTPFYDEERHRNWVSAP